MPKERRRVYFSGRVQGVGFRYTSQHLAQAFDVSGFVRNLDDGRVEILVEGERAVIDSFLEAVRASFGGKIRHEHAVTEAPDDSPLAGFTIRY
jgi:acylphosphatase